MRSHIDIRRRYLEQIQQEEKIEFLYVPSQMNLADPLTKASIPVEAFIKWRKEIMIDILKDGQKQMWHKYCVMIKGVIY